MDTRICKTEASVVGDGWSHRIGPGQHVDLDAVIPGSKNQTIREMYREDIFAEAPATSVDVAAPSHED